MTSSNKESDINICIGSSIFSNIINFNTQKHHGEIRDDGENCHSHHDHHPSHINTWWPVLQFPAVSIMPLRSGWFWTFKIGQDQATGEGFLKHQQSRSTNALGTDSLRSFFPSDDYFQHWCFPIERPYVRTGVKGFYGKKRRSDIDI